MVNSTLSLDIKYLSAASHCKTQLAHLLAFTVLGAACVQNNRVNTLDPVDALWSKVQMNDTVLPKCI